MTTVMVTDGRSAGYRSRQKHFLCCRGLPPHLPGHSKHALQAHSNNGSTRRHASTPLQYHFLTSNSKPQDTQQSHSGLCQHITELVLSESTIALAQWLDAGNSHCWLTNAPCPPLSPEFLSAPTQSGFTQVQGRLSAHSSPHRPPSRPLSQLPNTLAHLEHRSLLHIVWVRSPALHAGVNQQHCQHTTSHCWYFTVKYSTIYDRIPSREFVIWNYMTTSRYGCHNHVFLML